MTIAAGEYRSRAAKHGAESSEDDRGLHLVPGNDVKGLIFVLSFGLRVVKADGESGFDGLR